MATIDIGKIKPVFKGTYDNSTAYVLDDIVYYNGSSYVAKTSTTGNLPTDNTKWNVLASGAGGIYDSTLSLGTAGQALVVNSGASALEFSTITSGEYSIHKIDSYNYDQNVSGAYNSDDYIDISGGNTVNFTPTSTNDFVFFGHGSRLNWGNASQGGDVYLMMKAGSASIGSGDTKINYNGQHHVYTNILNDQYFPVYKTVLLPCSSLTPGTTYYVEQAGATHTAGSTMTFNGSASGGTGYVAGMHRHHVNMIHYKKN